MRKVAFLILVSLLTQAPARADSLDGDMAYTAGDFATAYREWSSAAAQGDPSAMAALGTLYDTGHGVGQDFARALDWYRRAAEAGSVRGMFNVGAMYDNGRGTPVDRPTAIYWYSRAAEQGHGRAAFALGLIYRNGDGVPRNRAAAVRFFQIAAEAGIGAARTNLAQLRGPVPAPPGAAASASSQPAAGAARPAPDADAEASRVQKAVLSRAALDGEQASRFAALVPLLTDQAAGDARLAQYDVGYAFEHGTGVSRDPVRSYVYYLRAAASPDQSIKAASLRGAADVARSLTAAQHTAARDMLLDGSR